MDKEKPPIRNIETAPSQQEKIEEKGTIPMEVMVERLDRCAKQEGLEKGYFSSDEEIRKVLEKNNVKVLPNLPLSVQLNLFLQDKYGDYLWRGYRERHEHD